MSFDEWLKVVDYLLSDSPDYEPECTEDYPWEDDYNDGLSPEESVELFMEMD